jgi:Aminotransferase class-III
LFVPTRVDADICTFAKAMANGYPIAVVAGREEVMRKFGGGVVHGGTYTAHSVSLAAAEACLGIPDDTDALETIAICGGVGRQNAFSPRSREKALRPSRIRERSGSGAATTTAAERGGDLPKDTAEVGAQGWHHRDNHHGDKRRDQPIFDRRHTRFVLEQPNQIVHWKDPLIGELTNSCRRRIH